MNIFFPPHQEKVFIVMLLFGFGIGILYDLFKIKRRLLSENSIILFIDDLFFSLLSVMLFLFTVFIANNGIFRWYEILFSMIGYMLYRITLSKPLIFFSYKIIDLFLLILKRIFTICVYPTKRLVLIFSPVKQALLRRTFKHRILKFSKKIL